MFGMGTGVSPLLWSPGSYPWKTGDTYQFRSGPVMGRYPGFWTKAAWSPPRRKPTCGKAGKITVKPNDRLVPVSSRHCCPYTPGLSTSSSSRGLQGDLILEAASRLDAFSGYPVRT